MSFRGAESSSYRDNRFGLEDKGGSADGLNRMLAQFHSTVVSQKYSGVLSFEAPGNIGVYAAKILAGSIIRLSACIRIDPSL